jgi:L,D-transpeptidase-like protein
MDESVKHGLKVGLYLVWIVAVGVGMFRDIHRIGELYRSIQRTQAMTDELALASRGIEASTRLIRGGSRDVQFLQSLVSLLPQNKSFIRTQRAMMDEVEALRYKVGRRVKDDLHVLVDTKANKLYVKKGLTLLWEADCSVGKGGILTDKETGRRWEFATPRGQFEIRDKIEKPLWNKPDWAFVEEHKPIPPLDDPSRHVEGELGAYVFNLGDGYLIHGTKDESVLGRPVSHGCVRLSAVDLKRLYDTVPRWTKVYIY